MGGCGNVRLRENSAANCQQVGSRLDYGSGVVRANAPNGADRDGQFATCAHQEVGLGGYSVRSRGAGVETSKGYVGSARVDGSLSAHEIIVARGTDQSPGKPISGLANGEVVRPQVYAIRIECKSQVKIVVNNQGRMLRPAQREQGFCSFLTFCCGSSFVPILDHAGAARDGFFNGFQ